MRHFLLEICMFFEGEDKLSSFDERKTKVKQV